MLGKLLKYEIKATARLFLPIYLVILVFALINKTFNIFDTIETYSNFNIQVFLSTLSIMLYFVLIVGVVIMTLVIMIQRFYKNLLGDEGYLMFTLPVKPWQHIISKLISAMMWTILSFITIVFSVIILIGIKQFFGEIPYVISNFKFYLGNSIFYTILVFAILQLAAAILMVYSAISLGHLFPKHKIIASFGMFCALYFLYQFIGFISLLLFGRSFIFNVVSTGTPTPSQINFFLLSLYFLPIVMIIGNFLLTNFILKKHLNLE